MLPEKVRGASTSPKEFPVQSDPSTPILTGTDPKSTHLPPKRFPNGLSENNSTGPPILSGTEANITEAKNNHAANTTHEEAKPEDKPAGVENPATAGGPQKPANKSSGEEDDMLHTKYKGGHDVDELRKPDKKATEKDEKKPSISKKDPKSEVDLSPTFDKKGPKLMNESKSGESVLGSSTKMMAVSSSVLSSTQQRHHSILEPAKTAVTVLLSIAVVVCLTVIGILVWKRIAMRRFGRDVLINEDDFDEVSDMHTFDRAQIQIT